MSRKRLGEMLIDAKVIDDVQLRNALGEQRRWGGALGKILIDLGFVTEGVLVRSLSKQLNIPIVQLDTIAIAPEVLGKVSVELAEQHGVIPFQMQLKFLDVAMSDPMNMGILDELQIRTRLNVRPHLAGATQIQRAIRRSYYSEVDHEGVDVDFEDGAIIPSRSEKRRSEKATFNSRSDNLADMREAEIAALQRRLSTLEALVARDENVIRKLLGLLVKKGVASREEILEAIK